VKTNEKEAIFYAELDNLYQLNNTSVESRLVLFDGKNDVVSKRDDAFVQQITVLTLAGQPEKSVEYLEGKTFNYREGTSRVREIIIDAHLSLGIKYYNQKHYEKALGEFLLAQIPEEEAGSARFGNREIQVNYFIAQAYTALGNNKKAKEFYRKSAEVEVPERLGIMNYYQGLSYLELKEKQKADHIFMAMVKRGTEQLERKNDADFFAIFGEREAEGTRTSMAYTIRGLGYKGLSDNENAKADLEKAVELSVGNLWAATELKNM
jgi:tetratricopeptide (TPR) repeat protein